MYDKYKIIKLMHFDLKNLFYFFNDNLNCFKYSKINLFDDLLYIFNNL